MPFNLPQEDIDAIKGTLDAMKAADDNGQDDEVRKHYADATTMLAGLGVPLGTKVLPAGDGE